MALSKGMGLYTRKRIENTRMAQRTTALNREHKRELEIPAWKREQQHYIDSTSISREHEHEKEIPARNRGQQH